VNDQQLLAAYLQGDEDALASLVTNYYRLVVATATRATSDPDLAQDIAQTVFLLFTRKARRLRKEVSLPGWFIRTANFVSRDVLKKVARRSHYEAASSEEPRNATEAHEASGAALLLTEAILALSPKEQVCVLARFYDERGTSEIAREHGISEDAAQKRIERGLEKLRSFFARRGFRIATGIMPGLFIAAFPRGADAQAVQTVLGGLHAAKTGVASTATLLQTKHLAQAISRRELLSIGLKSGVALLVAATGVGSYVAVHEPAVPALPPFRPSSPQVDALGRAWAQVARQIAAIMSDPQARQRVAITPPANIVNETGRISSELGSLLTASRDDRAGMAEFLTIELRETLGLSPRQQAYVFSLFHQKFAPGNSFMNTLKEAIAAKDEIARQIRAHLSYLQQRRFDYTYGKNFLGFMSFASLFTDGELRL
jgi:RNA polymerase sigma factor (sigma-70 family)